jgi:hypothetical protein
VVIRGRASRRRTVGGLMPATADVSLPEQVDRYAEAVRGEIGVLDPLALDVGGSDHGSRTPRRSPHTGRRP